MSTVSVIGASGRQGLAQIKRLLKTGYAVRALSRDTHSNMGGMADDVDIRHMEMDDEASIVSAITGSDFVFYNQPLQMNHQRVELAERVGRACKKADISRLVWNTSSWIPERPGDPFTYAHNTTAINKLWALGIPATVFGSVLFMDNLLTDWARPSLINERRYIYPHAPHVEANWISLDDVAKIMVASLNRPDMVGAWMNIGGPEKLTGPMVTQILSEVLGFELNYDPCTPEQFAVTLAEVLGYSMEPEARKIFLAYFSDFYHYNNTSPTKPFSVNTQYMLERLPEIKLETMREWAARQDWSEHPDRPSGG